MQLSTLIGAAALVLAGLLATGHAFSEGTMPAARETGQKKVDEREAKRRAAVEEQQKRKEDFARRCGKPVMSSSELESCRVAYRGL